MAINLTRLKQRLDALARQAKIVKWKMNVKLPGGWVEHTEFEQVTEMVHAATNLFWKKFKNNCPMDVEQVWQTFTSNKKIEHRFKIVGFNTSIADWRDAVDYKHSKKPDDFVAVKVVAEMETEIAQRQLMLLDDPLELSFSGKLIRKKKSREIQSVEFTALRIDDGVVEKILMEV